MEDDYPDEVEERLINEEYKIWKKNTPFLYGKSPPEAPPAAVVVLKQQVLCVPLLLLP
jgi:hypothetical protein